MQTKQLGNSDLKLTPIGVGAWAMGGAGWAFAWGPQDDDDSISAIRAALDRGVNWIDTAAVYGLGHSEEVVGRGVKGLAKPPYVFTKCARIWNERREIGKSLKADSVRREVEASLRRLQVERIDLYQIHWPEPDEQVEEGWTTLAQLKAEGKVRYIGVSNFSANQMRRAQAIGVAETDPSADLDGWDAAVKVAALTIVLMGVPIQLDQVKRTGIRELSEEKIRSVRAAGMRYKLVCRAERRGDTADCTVQPELLLASDPLANLEGTSSAIRFDLDVFSLSLVEHNPGIEATAYGMLADFVRAVQS